MPEEKPGPATDPITILTNRILALETSIDELKKKPAKSFIDEEHLNKRIAELRLELQEARKDLKKEEKKEEPKKEDVKPNVSEPVQEEGFADQINAFK